MIIFLAVCVNEGIGVKDLVYICGLSDSMVSRAVDSLCRADGGRLLTVERHATDGRRRLVYLTEEGRKLLASLSEALSAGEEDNSAKPPGAGAPLTAKDIP